jgi:hypothetical protein
MRKKKHIHRQPCKLPQLKAPDQLWEGIEARLAKEDHSDRMISKLAASLPEYAPEQDLWKEISSRLDKEQSTVVSSKRHYLGFTGLVAMVLLLIGALRFFGPGETVSYSYEKGNSAVIEPGSVHAPKPSAGIDGNIAEYCRKMPEVCRRPIFQDIQVKIAELERKEESLVRLISAEKDQKLGYYLVRIRNEKMELSRELLKMFTL